MGLLPLSVLWGVVGVVAVTALYFVWGRKVEKK
jgi:hypothetical protein